MNDFLKRFLELVLLLAYGPLIAMFSLYLVAAILRWRGKPGFWNWLVQQTSYERNGKP